jgi:hypothetical protein
VFYIGVEVKLESNFTCTFYHLAGKADAFKFLGRLERQLLVPL